MKAASVTNVMSVQATGVSLVDIVAAYAVTALVAFVVRFGG
jgi:hypothetical protein